MSVSFMLEELGLDAPNTSTSCQIYCEHHLQTEISFSLELFSDYRPNTTWEFDSLATALPIIYNLLLLTLSITRLNALLLH